MRILPAVLHLAMCAPFAGAQEATEETKLKEEIRALELKVVACGLMQRLEITDDQAKTLLDLAKKAAVAKTDYQDRLVKLRQEQVKAFTDFRTEDIRNTGFSANVEGAAARAEHRETELRKRFFDRIAALERETPLTQEQIEVFASIKPENPATLVAIFERRAPPLVQKARTMPKAEQVREELREIHKEHYGEIGPVGRFLLLPGLVEVLSKRLGVKLEGAPVVTDAAPS